MTCHKGETPDITQAYCRTSRCKDYGYLTSKYASSFHLKQTKLMQENKQDTDGANIFHQEKVDMEQGTIVKCSPVGEFIAHYLMGHKPTNQDAGQEAHDRQEQLSCDKVEETEQRHTKEMVTLHSTQRKGAEDG